MQIIKDIIGFIGDLKGIDVLLYFAILVLIILVVSLIYIIKTSEEENFASSNEEIEDLKTLVHTIENKESPAIALTDYEAEQEAKAIISYEELLEKNKCGAIHYEESPIKNEEVSIKKINLDTLMDKPKENKNIVFYNYQREEEFLKCLQALNQLLN